ncbi:fumarylacetoacetate hydrolase family protein [Siccirubricoccus sp. KC 17139]|uniref:Fumarylacetoacetate hydrolase family protein n=1 Tax=Siccirubricoccus soli TaxID=2899147 RepID=A0ABT1D342_9PROT|nr:fumarylacetoacetate hydrolase family protein [Siccirubricoccus soli]MCO6416353.1 fumarylacetoacetate hydrolase family protein [Siccirubricoccus soli]MCP2682487.1 fumarylacetoacetate hydrolase family protein [Siccirubricoccus soli]
MKIISFATRVGESYGLVQGEGIVDCGRRLHYPGVKAVLEAGALGELTVFAAAEPDHALADVTVLPAVPQDRKVLCVGLNYRAHVAEAAGREVPENPRIFARLADTIIGHGAPLWRPANSTHFDYEGELAVVIGKPGRRIPAARALEHVAAYTIFQDGSVRDYQKHSVTAGKNFPHTGPLGPWLVSADEIPDPAALTLTTRVNGEQRQRTSTGDMILSVEALIEYISAFTPLAPGDVIATGTPEGVAHARKPPPWLVPGDVVEVEISGIGTLRNPVIAEPTA